MLLETTSERVLKKKEDYIFFLRTEGVDYGVSQRPRVVLSILISLGGTEKLWLFFPIFCVVSGGEWFGASSDGHSCEIAHKHSDCDKFAGW